MHSRVGCRRVAWRLVLPGLSCLMALPARGEVLQWTQPDLDWLAYANVSGSGGNRAFGPSWIGGLEIDPDSNAFVPLGNQGPARLGMPLIAFDTTSEVPSGLSASQYQVSSVKLTATMASSTFPGESLFYDDTPDAQAEILADIQSGNFDSQRPFELYGVGFREGFTGFEFAIPPSDPTLLDELNKVHPNNAVGYLAYPISSDAGGQPLDVSNSITGGFSATAPGNTTLPFDPTPWAIGVTDLAVGSAIPDNTTFTFDVDLTEPGVLAYVQQSLSDGGLGFFLSSLTLASQPGLGVFPYPQWYLRESLGGAVNGIPPTLEIDVSLGDALAGDYNADGTVNTVDYAVWRDTFGQSVPVGVSADGDASGMIDGADYLIWQVNFGQSTSSAVATTVPEPSFVVLLATSLVCSGARRRRSGWT